MCSVPFSVAMGSSNSYRYGFPVLQALGSFLIFRVLSSAVFRSDPFRFRCLKGGGGGDLFDDCVFEGKICGKDDISPAARVEEAADRRSSVVVVIDGILVEPISPEE
jgi:hypothetical protein